MQEAVQLEADEEADRDDDPTLEDTTAFNSNNLGSAFKEASQELSQIDEEEARLTTADSGRPTKK